MMKSESLPTKSEPVGLQFSPSMRYTFRVYIARYTIDTKYSSKRDWKTTLRTPRATQLPTYYLGSLLFLGRLQKLSGLVNKLTCAPHYCKYGVL